MGVCRTECAGHCRDHGDRALTVKERPSDPPVVVVVSLQKPQLWRRSSVSITTRFECRVTDLATRRISRCLTSLAPQAPHKAALGTCFAWSEGFTTSFATRGSRVQIPSAPLKPLVRAISGNGTSTAGDLGFRFWGTHIPQRFRSAAPRLSNDQLPSEKSRAPPINPPPVARIDPRSPDSETSSRVRTATRTPAPKPMTLAINRCGSRPV